MKTNWLRRVVALVMSFLMAVTMIPETVFAENATSIQPVSVHVYESTPGDVASEKYTLQAGRTNIPVVKYSANGNHVDVARFASDSRTPEMQVTVKEDINSVTVYPQRYYPQDVLSVSEDKHTLTFSMAEGLPYAIVMINGGPADQKGKPYLALINDPLETEVPDKSASNVLNFQEFSEKYLQEHPNDTEVGKKVVEAGTTSGGQAYGEGVTVASDAEQVRFPNKRALEADDLSAALQAALDEIYKEGSVYDTLYFPAGTYKYSGLEIRNRKGKAVNIYLEEGALLKNRIQECMQAMEPAIGIWDSENITISGRGIFDGNGVANYRKDRHDAKDSCHQGGVMIVRSSNIIFQDTYVRDAKQWNWESHGSKNCTLNNIKGLTPYPQPWVDGLDMASAQDLDINGAFTLGNDDCFASGHYNPSDGFTNTVPGFDEYNADYVLWDTEDSFNVSVKNTLGWSCAGGNGIRMGHNCYGHQMKNYTFDNVNSVNFQGGGRGITVQNNTGEYPRYESVIIKNSSFDTTRVGANAEIFGKDEQTIQEVVLENCYFNGASGTESKKFDFQNIENLTVKDLWVNGAKVSYTSDLNLNTSNISEFIFKNGDAVVENNHLPVITFPGSTIAAYAENPLVFCVKAEDEGDTLIYAADLGELAGKASFDAAAGRFRWTPSQEDIGKSYDVKFTVTDHTGKPVEAVVKLTVSSSKNSMQSYTVSEDAHIQSWKTEKTMNFGATLYLIAMNTKKGEMGENGSTNTSDATDGKMIFLKFDLSQMKEQKEAFDKAQLCLTYVTLRKDADKNKDDTLKVAVIEDDSWTEGTGDSKGNTNGGITWNTKPSFTIDASAVKTSDSYNLGAAYQDKPGSGFAVNGTRVTVDITGIVKKALDNNKEKLSLVVNEADGYEHYFVSKEGAGESGYNSATPDMAPSIQLNIPIAIDLEGPSELTLTEGYAAAETQSFALKGGSGPYHVTLSGNTGNGKITWDADTNQIKIAEGLAKGVYEVTVTSASSKDASVKKSMVFTLTVEELPVPTVTGVSVSPAQVNVKQGEEQIFAAEVTGENNPSKEVVWSVSGAVSSGTAITTEGKLTVGSDETAKILTVTAVSKADQEKSGTAIVTVIEKTVEPIEPVDPVKYTVSLDANGGEVSPKSMEVEKGKKIGALPTPTKTDCTFQGWYTAKENGETVTEETIVNGNMIIYAHWKMNQQTEDPKPPTEQQITDLNTKVAAAEELLDKLSNEEKEKLQPVINEMKELLKKENVTAKEIEEALSKLSAAVEAAENTIESVKYTVSLDANGGEVSPKSVEVEKGKKIGALPTPTKADCTFEGWYTAKENGEAVTKETIVNGNMTIYAQWEENQQTEEPKPPTEQQITELNTKVAAAEELMAKLSNEEKEKLQPVINEVKELLKKENVTAGEIEEALSRLVAAVEAAEKTIETDDEKPRLNQIFNGSNGLKYKITAYKGTVKNLAVNGATKQFTSLTVPATVNYKGENFKVTAIGDQALANQKKLKSIVIGKHVTSIGKKAFYNDKKLTKVTFKGTAVKKIGKDAFKGISKKAVFSMKKTFTYKNLKYKITKCTASLKQVTITGASKKFSSLSVPAVVKYNGMSFKVTAVNKKAFRNQSKLKSVTIGKNVKSIGSEAFSGCKKLAKIKFSGTAIKSIGKNAFKSIKKNAVFSMKKSKKAFYKKLLKKAKTKNFKVK